MSKLDLGNLSEEARLWIYGSSNEINESQIDFVRHNMDMFVEQWLSHKREVTGGWDLKYDRFFFMAADESVTDISGCSIDTIVHNLQFIEKETGLDIVNNQSKVFFRDSSDGIRCVTRAEFKQLSEQGDVSGETIVFDNTIQTVADLKAGKWELPLRSSWHGRVFEAALHSTNQV